jgi:hypothetical protein
VRAVMGQELDPMLGSARRSGNREFWVGISDRHAARRPRGPLGSLASGLMLCASHWTLVGAGEALSVGNLAAFDRGWGWR